jgi:exopolysaccharide production protein ExoY
MRGFDIVAAASVLLLTAPLLVAIALLVWAMDGGPALFSQPRIGRDGRHFRCLKFRSMCVDADARLARLLASDENARREWQADHKLRVDPRITRLGRFLRKTSLDETPQLINVLRGEMSLVGPRPIVDAEITRYGRRFAAYCAQRPGITGLWQVSGRNDVSYRRRVALDTAYAARKSIALDMRILAATIPAVLLRRGSY